MVIDTRPDPTKTHIKIVETIDYKNKTFPSAQGTRAKYIITFKDGYKAEYCPIVGQPLADIAEGQPATFKIKHRKDFGDEIEFTNGSANISTPAATSSKITNLHGHPASLALLAAKDIFLAGKNPEDTIFEMLEDADTIFEWLTKKATE